VQHFREPPCIVTLRFKEPLAGFIHLLTPSCRRYSQSLHNNSATCCLSPFHLQALPCAEQSTLGTKLSVRNLARVEQRCCSLTPTSLTGETYSLIKTRNTKSRSSEDFRCHSSCNIWCQRFMQGSAAFEPPC